MEDPRVLHWAASGAMALTGLPEAPLGPPEGLVDGIEDLARPFEGLDGLALLGERAVHMGLWRRGRTSCGGSCRLLSSEDGDLAVSLARDEDFEAVPAWLELDVAPASTPAAWAAVAHAVAHRDAGELVARAALLGLPVARVGEAAGRPSLVRVPLGSAPPCEPAGLFVLDLTALWAGPLCGDLLAGAGATVIKLESSARPDGARRGPAGFFDLLNGRKRSVAVDFRSREGVEVLRALVRRADVVLEASRPRALEQLGIHAAEEVRAGGPRVWVSITGYGRDGEAGARVAFGDDAAGGGGLVVWHEGAAMFCADAVADPVTGLAAARACLDALASGGRWLLDISMGGVCAALAGPTLPVPADVAVAPPRARPARSAPEFGADTAQVLAELGLSM